jgi:hypothetical protein
VFATAHLELSAEELLLELRNLWCHVAVLILPFIYRGGTVVVIVVP